MNNYWSTSRSSTASSRQLSGTNILRAKSKSTEQLDDWKAEGKRLDKRKRAYSTRDISCSKNKLHQIAVLEETAPKYAIARSGLNRESMSVATIMSPKSPSSYSNTSSATLDETLYNVKMELSSLCNERADMEKRIRDLVDGIEGIRVKSDYDSASDLPTKTGRRSSLFLPIKSPSSRIKAPSIRLQTKQQRYPKHSKLTLKGSLPVYAISSIPEENNGEELSHSSGAIKSRRSSAVVMTRTKSVPKELENHISQTHLPVPKKSTPRSSNERVPKNELSTWYESSNMYEYCSEPEFRKFQVGGILTSEKHYL